MQELLYEEETYKIIGACMKVHRNLGAGFLESVYQEALGKEFTAQNIAYKEQPKLSLKYDGAPLKKYFVADFVCYDQIIIEIKAATFLNKIMAAQTINYLKATGLQIGLLINFGRQSLTWNRFINT